MMKSCSTIEDEGFHLKAIKDSELLVILPLLCMFFGLFLASLKKFKDAGAFLAQCTFLSLVFFLTFTR